MIRKIIHIDEEKCNGCGLCASAKPSWCERISVTGLATACRVARPELSPLRSVRLPNTTKKLYRKQRRKRKWMK